MTLRETPRSLKILRKVFGLLDRLKDGLVDLLLVSGLGLGERLLLLGLALREKLLLSGLRALLGRLGEVGVSELLIELNGTNNVSVKNHDR